MYGDLMLRGLSAPECCLWISVVSLISYGHPYKNILFLITLSLMQNKWVSQLKKKKQKKKSWENRRNIDKLINFN